MEEHRKTTLVSFLGIGSRQRDDSFDYNETQYVLNGKPIKTKFVAIALASFFRVNEIHILGTEKAKELHWERLCSLIRSDLKLQTPDFHPIAEGGKPEELWNQFNTILDLIKGIKDAEIIVDITHGFRAQPFFAAAILAFVRAMYPENRDFRVVYGAFQPGEPETPIWDLTPFIELVDWTWSLMLFLRTGYVKEATIQIRKTGKRLAKEWATGGKVGKRPELDRFADALESFGDDLVTVRTGDLIIGRDGRNPSSQELIKRLEENRSLISDDIPPLAEVLDEIKKKASSVASKTLQGYEGEKALAALAGLYLEMRRYAEAAAVFREAWITRFAEPSAARPGFSDYSPEAREKAEKKWRTTLKEKADDIGQSRNDINHAGFNRTPAKARTLMDSIRRHVEELEETAGIDRAPVQTKSEKPTSEDKKRVFVNLSNHPQSLWSEEQKKAALSFAEEIIDLPFPGVPPEFDEVQVGELADEIVSQIPTNTAAVMVMGEFTLTVEMIRRLQHRGIRCLSATTVRDVYNDVQGRKVSSFRFVRFREYPRLDC